MTLSTSDFISIFLASIPLIFGVGFYFGRLEKRLKTLEDKTILLENTIENFFNKIKHL